MSPLTLGIDLSTQSCSALVIDPTAGRVVAEASVNYGRQLPQYGAPSGFIPGGSNGEVHADPRMWLDALEQLLSELGTQCDLSRVDAISGAGQQHASVYLGQGWLEAIRQLDPQQSLASQLAPCLTRATSPIWMDTSTGVQCREIAEAAGGASTVVAKSGSLPTERFTGPQIRRFWQTNPDAYADTTRIHLVSSFLASVITGNDAPLDTGDAAGMNLLNVHRWNWDDELLAATAPDLRQRLPQVVDGKTQIGTLADYFVRKFGFKAGTPVIAFTGDNPDSLVGMGASQPGKAVISLGTSDTFFAAMPAVVTDPDGFGHVFGNPLGGAMSLQCFVNGSLAREAVRDRFGLDWTGFTTALKSTPPGNKGRLMVPFFRPEVSPRFDCDAPLLRGDDQFCRWEEPAAAIRACVEGQFINMNLRSAWMQLSPETIYLTGGASRNDAIAQVAADVFQARVERLAVSGSVALGAALRAATYGLGENLRTLESLFCQPIAGSGLDPIAPHDTYIEPMQHFAGLCQQ